MKRHLFCCVIFFFATSSFAQYNRCLDTVKIQTAVYTKLDGYLDDFRINWPCDPSDFKITFYDRYGKIIYESEQADFVWYCRDKTGKKLTTGTYMWVMSYVFEDRKVHKQGKVSLTP